ncbi:damage-inducible protein DinB [Larkinella knui]|uniref:Damage-inducible protein DinB n=1 Tax=Larkinella knui TaxID=2025310 RepID=A0A3P1CAW0_9BACT|nr:DinB family protein [Larkinella knui]RRB10398.1 damage-inducible protein DinB [Larkinella knui]
MAQALAEQTELTVASFLTDLAIYNQWANQTLVDWLKTKPAGLMVQPVPSSFPSLKETLLHIWDTQRFWLSVLQQTTPPQSFRWFGFEGTVDDVFEGILQQSAEMTTYALSLTASEWQEQVIFTSPWAEGVRSRIEFFQHCLNHSTYHRGQLVTIGRNVGLTDAPMTDYSFYFLRT